MKILEKNKLEQLLEIIEHSPALRIAHFDDANEEFVETLYQFCAKYEYEYQLNATDDGFYERAVTHYENGPIINITNFNTKRANYRVQGREYEYIFVTSKIEDDAIELFLKRVYPIIKRAGNIIIFLPKDDYTKGYKYMELLEKNNFVASNTINDLFDDWSVIISKRMHGWGN